MDPREIELQNNLKFFLFSRGILCKYKVSFLYGKDMDYYEVEFGSRGKQHYKDLTPLQLYKKNNHGDINKLRAWIRWHRTNIKRFMYTPTVSLFWEYRYLNFDKIV